jgi:hypothetical protein
MPKLDTPQLELNDVTSVWCLHLESFTCP